MYSHLIYQETNDMMHFSCKEEKYKSNHRHLMVATVSVWEKSQNLETEIKANVACLTSSVQSTKETLLNLRSKRNGNRGFVTIRLIYGASSRQPYRLSGRRVIRNSPLERPRELTSKCRVVFIMPCHLGVCVDKFLAMSANLFGKMKAWRHEASVKIFMKKKCFIHETRSKQNNREAWVGRKLPAIPPRESRAGPRSPTTEMLTDNLSVEISS